ncbi:MAG: hypothetical protein JKX75_02690, partial [Gammaproteobacteria bacterium]|nr:hypothetical protein [Gammaproteobacteria bacterium]
NLDLMFGLPDQTVQQAIHDIETACRFDVPHISHYQLTIEENTYFYKHTPVLPETDQLWDMQIQCQNILIANNYQQYEISAYSKPTKPCSHNINYWTFGDYIGIGAGAHGKLTNDKNSVSIENKAHITRRWKHRQPQQYIEQTLKGNAVSGTQVLTQQDTVFEFLLNALRLKAGSNLQTYQDNTGLDIDTLRHAIKHIDRTLLVLDKSKICTTDKGYLFLNEILENLL